MGNRIISTVLIAIMLTGLFAATAFANVYTFDIPNPNESVLLDLGMTFTDISDVRVACSGDVVFGRYLDTNMVMQDVYPKLNVDVWDDHSLLYQRGEMISTAGSFSNLQLDMFDTTLVCFLVDGHTNLHMWSQTMYPSAYSIYTYYSNPSITLSSAQLIIDGTAPIVPEPSSIVPLLGGLLGLLVVKRRKA